MFNAPEVFLQIPDISTIYRTNDRQIAELEDNLSALDDSIFLDLMPESAIRRWEKVLKIERQDNDSLEDRRFRVKVKRLERLPYSYRVVLKKLSTLCPDGFVLECDENLTNAHVKLALTSKKMRGDVEKLLDEILPLNMLFSVSIFYNQYLKFKDTTHAQMKVYTHNQLREDAI